ncbi:MULTISPECIES: maleate cis-trans isomerase family protein [Thermomonosporaceae]|uniref:maleate cis-trans isomerase family protein n=1 Tax=Thermomonosporaceae TaxID=2012 RepID=UPI00255B1BAD|nr:MULTISPECIES: maleate cis-trans isomerase [Thermomonosporaceae]MDL4774624.1 maleate cis-trans isomerase [Actinomadura xylanilytica]
MGPIAGFLYPGYSAEDDYPVIEGILGAEGRLPVVHTVMREDAHRVDALLDIGGPEVLAEGARALREKGVRAAVWACTSGSFVFGWDGAAEQVKGVQEAAGVPASSTSFAFVNAARHLGLRKVAVAATYPADVAERFVEFLGHADIEVVALSCRGIVTAAEVGTLGRDEVLDFVAANDHPDAEAVLVPDTALHSVAWLDELEARLGKPVLTANQVSVWEGLRLAAGPQAEPPSRPGLGRLFSEPARTSQRK